jgi:hypothetical protein
VRFAVQLAVSVVVDVVGVRGYLEQRVQVVLVQESCRKHVREEVLVIGQRRNILGAAMTARRKVVKRPSGTLPTPVDGHG